ncbi:hypothetical protein C8R43DRAFT_641443 [Mycena crocata]|nr:hypothetical protein C8R43DRAFT_641443 [Mycena crocata]
MANLSHIQISTSRAHSFQSSLFYLLPHDTGRWRLDRICSVCRHATINAMRRVQPPAVVFSVPQSRRAAVAVREHRLWCPPSGFEAQENPADQHLVSTLPLPGPRLAFPAGLEFHILPCREHYLKMRYGSRSRSLRIQSRVPFFPSFLSLFSFSSFLTHLLPPRSSLLLPPLSLPRIGTRTHRHTDSRTAPQFQLAGFSQRESSLRSRLSFKPS